jgi:hypothetical protein
LKADSVAAGNFRWRVHGEFNTEFSTLEPRRSCFTMDVLTRFNVIAYPWLQSFAKSGSVRIRLERKMQQKQALRRSFATHH